MAAIMMRSSTMAGKVATTRRNVSARAGNWMPGSDAPAHLKVEIPGNFGFDPCGLAKEPASLLWFREAEVIHCRWAMLGAAGVLGVEALGFGNWYDAPLPLLNGEKATFFGAQVPFDLTTLGAIELFAMGMSEKLRLENTGERIYPGGSFDPMGMSKGANVEELKLKEIKNGRLAMCACAGFLMQHLATGKAPLAALGDHLANPWGANCGTNGISIPF